MLTILEGVSSYLTKHLICLINNKYYQNLREYPNSVNEGGANFEASRSMHV